MFEQSTVTGKSRPWTFAVSLTLQCSTMAAVILVSILHVERLAPVTLLNPLPPFPKLDAVKVVSVHRATSAAPSSGVTAPRPFVVPRHIPTVTPVIVDPAAEAPSVAGRGIGQLDTGIYGAVGIEARPGIPPDAAVQTPTKPAISVPAQAPRAPVRLGGNVLEAKIIHRVVPPYPPLARNMRISGAVRLVGIIDREGKIKSLQVLGGHPLLVKAALDAVREWRYSPTLLNGEAVEVVAPIDVNFTLAGQ